MEGHRTPRRYRAHRASTHPRQVLQCARPCGAFRCRSFGWLRSSKDCRRLKGTSQSQGTFNDRSTRDSPVEIPESSQKPVLRRQCGNPAGKSLLRPVRHSPARRRMPVRSTLLHSFQNPKRTIRVATYDQSGAIRSQNTMPVRPLLKNPCHANQAKSTMGKQCITSFDGTKGS